MGFSVHVNALATLLWLLILPFAGQAAVRSIEQPLDKHQAFAYTLASMSVEDLASVSAAELKKKLGRNLALRERIALKVLRKKARQAIKKGKSLNEEGARYDGFALAAGVVGIVSVATLFFAFFVGAALGVVALILATIGQARIRKAPERRKGQGFIVVGAIAGGIGILLLLFYLAFSNMTFAI